MAQNQALSTAFAMYFRPKLLVILCLGFVSGLPLALSGATLAAWLKESGVDLAAIGLFAAVATPYSLKFLWAPFIDGLPFPLLSRLLGRRRGWIIGTQALLAVAIIGLGFSDPSVSAWQTAYWALLVATLSATQDIVIDAYRVEILEKEQYAAGAAMVQYGYRLGMWISGGLALIIADQYGWSITYLLMAALIGVGAVTVLLSKEPENIGQGGHAKRLRAAEWLQQTLIAPFTDFMTHKGWVLLLLFTVFYKMGDAFLGVMTTPFLLEIGFSKTQIGVVVKTFGLPATLVGLYLGGLISFRLGNMRALMWCGIGHALTNLMFLVQAHVGADVTVLALGIAMENVSGGMTAVAFVAFLSSLCHRQFTATQYALLSSLAAVGRTWLSTPAGWFAETMGWEMFFIFAVLLAVPGLVLLWLLSKLDRTPGNNTNI